ncbi:hypothetical protein ACLOJK_012141 [Asimina triloba]
MLAGTWVLEITVLPPSLYGCGWLLRAAFRRERSSGAALCLLGISLYSRVCKKLKIRFLLALAYSRWLIRRPALETPERTDVKSLHGYRVAASTGYAKTCKTYLHDDA